MNTPSIVSNRLNSNDIEKKNKRKQKLFIIVIILIIQIQNDKENRDKKKEKRVNDKIIRAEAQINQMEKRRKKYSTEKRKRKTFKVNSKEEISFSAFLFVVYFFLILLFRRIVSIVHVYELELINRF